MRHSFSILEAFDFSKRQETNIHGPIYFKINICQNRETVPVVERTKHDIESSAERFSAAAVYRVLELLPNEVL